MVTGKNLSRIKFLLRENEMPMFNDENLSDFIDSCDSESEALYELFLLKSENTALQIPGMTTPETSQYFKRLAQVYRPINTGILKEG